MFRLKKRTSKTKVEEVTDCFVSEIYERPLIDLGSTGNEQLNGILSPRYDDAVVGKYLQSQFTKSAQVYIDKYQHVEHFTNLISTAFRKIRFCAQGELTVLDIGSGAGNTIFPLLTMCPDARVIASDLSVEMLVSLKEGMQQFTIDQNTEYNCFLLQLNAEQLDFAEESFDLVMGGAILHHMVSPEKTLRGCAKVLKQGGYAIFFEPFEEGSIILRNAYNVILNDSREGTVSPEIKSLFQALIVDYDARMVRDKSLPRWGRLDDKWFFNKRFFTALSDQYGFSECIIYPLHKTERQFELQTEVYLRLGRGKTRDALPEWAWEIIRQYDQCFSEETKKDLLIEGCLILKK